LPLESLDFRFPIFPAHEPLALTCAAQLTRRLKASPTSGQFGSAVGHKRTRSRSQKTNQCQGRKEKLSPELSALSLSHLSLREENVKMSFPYQRSLISWQTARCFVCFYRAKLKIHISGQAFSIIKAAKLNLFRWPRDHHFPFSPSSYGPLSCGLTLFSLLLVSPAGGFD